MRFSYFFVIFAPMKHRRLILSVLVGLALGGTAQTAKAQDAKAAIRNHYAAAKAYVEQQREMEAGGDIYPVTEEQETDEQIYPDLCLDFATKRYNFAARDYYEEYLYDQQGRIEVIYASLPDLNEGKLCELRFYVNKGELIETIVKSRPLDGGTFETIYQGKTVPEGYSDSYESRLGAAKGIMELFKTINANREL